MALKVVGGSVTKEGYATSMSKSGAGGVIGKVTSANYTNTGTIASAGSFLEQAAGSGRTAPGPAVSFFADVTKDWRLVLIYCGRREN